MCRSAVRTQMWRECRWAAFYWNQCSELHDIHYSLKRCWLSLSLSFSLCVYVCVCFCLIFLSLSVPFFLSFSAATIDYFTSWLVVDYLVDYLTSQPYYHERQQYRSTDRLPDWLTDWPTDRSTHWPTDSLTDRPIYWPTDRIHWPTTDWSIDQQTSWSTDWPTDWWADGWTDHCVYCHRYWSTRQAITQIIRIWRTHCASLRSCVVRWTKVWGRRKTPISWNGCRIMFIVMDCLRSVCHTLS